MTTLVATVTAKEATLVSDQGITSDLMNFNQPKIYTQDTWLIGVTGSLRTANLLWHATSYPEPPQALIKQPASEWHSWIITNIIPEIRYTLEQHQPKPEREGLGNSDLYLTTHARTFIISSDLALQHVDTFWASGSGAHLALGALSVHQYNGEWNKHHTAHAKQAVEIAQQHDPYTRGNITGYTSHANGNITEA